MDDVAKLQEELFAARQAYALAQRTVTDLTSQLQDSKDECSTLSSQLRQHQQLSAENRRNVQSIDELEGFLAAKDAENKRLKGRNQLLQEEVAELRSKCDSKNLEASHAQGSGALQKSKLDEQAAQILLLKRQLLEMEEDVAAAESDALAARTELVDAPDRVQVSPLETTPNAGAQQELTALRALNAELRDRASHLEEQLVQKDRARQEADELATPRSSRRTIQTYAPEDVLALSATAIDVMPPESLRGALFCATDLLRSQQEKDVAATVRDEKSVQHLEQEVSALTASLKEAEMMGDMWQAQAQSSLRQIERLKDMLSEGATWEGEHEKRNGHSDTEIKQAPVASTDRNCDSCAKLQQLVLKHAAENADLELVVRSLLAEGLRGQQASCQIGRVTLPALYAIESRLLQLTS